MIETGEYMSSPVATVEPDAKVVKAAKLMDGKNIGSLVVIEDDSIVGIVTERDIIRKALAQSKDVKEITVRDIMTREVISVDKDASLMEVAALMKKHIMRRIVVVDGGMPVGIITSRDLIDLLV